MTYLAIESQCTCTIQSIAIYRFANIVGSSIEKSNCVCVCVCSSFIEHPALQKKNVWTVVLRCYFHSELNRGFNVSTFISRGGTMTDYLCRHSSPAFTHAFCMWPLKWFASRAECSGSGKTLTVPFFWSEMANSRNFRPRISTPLNFRFAHCRFKRQTRPLLPFRSSSRAIRRFFFCLYIFPFTSRETKRWLKRTFANTGASLLAKLVSRGIDRLKRGTRYTLCGWKEAILCRLRLT